MAQVSLDQMVQALKTGPALVSFPTDTVPALAAAPTQASLIFEAKQRPPEKPLILMGAALSDLLPYVSGSSSAMAEWRLIALQHWPGQLTLVLPASDQAPKNLNPLPTDETAGTLGIRVPDHPVALALLSESGPLATTSANLSGQPALTEVLAIAQTFPGALTLASEHYQSKVASGTPSTVAKWTSRGWQILRQGKIQL